jgi:hypothetical protein
MAGTLMTKPVIVIINILLKSLIKFQPIRRNLDIDIVIFNRTPEPFDKDVINSPAFTIHTNLYTFLLKKLNPFITGKLTALI